MEKNGHNDAAGLFQNTPNDWKDISKKPIEYPFAFYKDTFSEKQHKYGTFKPMIKK